MAMVQPTIQAQLATLMQERSNDAAQVATQLAALAAARQEDTVKLDKLLNAIYGTNGDPGLRIQVDRLEQIEGVRRWTVKVMVGAVMGLIVRAFWGLLAQKGD